MTQDETKRFSIVVKSKEQGEPNGPGLTLVCAIAKLSDYPTKVTRVNQEAYDFMQIGQAYNVVLAKGALKAGKDGKYDNHYFWNWHGLIPSLGAPPAASTNEPPKVMPPDIPVLEPPVSELFPPEYRPPKDSREASIERQVALKEARLTTEWLLTTAKREQGEPKLSDLYLRVLSVVYRHMVELLQKEG